jgi:hypothetical protein
LSASIGLVKYGHPDLLSYLSEDANNGLSRDDIDIDPWFLVVPMFILK